MTAARAVALVAAGAVLVGCSAGASDPAPPTSHPGVSAPPTPTPTPSPVDPAAVPPERPDAMDTVDSAGAEGVARYFLALMPYAEATGDLTQIRSLSATECVFCTSVIDGVTKESQAGRHSTGGLVHISAAKALEVDPGKWWAVTVELTQDPSQTVDATGVPVEQKAAEVVGYHMDFAVIREGDRWLAREIGYEVVSRTAP